MDIDHRTGRLPDPAFAEEAGYYDGINFRRLMAWFIDIALILILAIVLIPFTAFTAAFFFPVFMVLVGFIYRVLTMNASSGTWGMRIMGMEIRQGDGSKLTFGTAFLHTLLYSVFLSIGILLLVSVVVGLVGSRKQGLHDLILGTAPIRTSA